MADGVTFTSQAQAFPWRRSCLSWVNIDLIAAAGMPPISAIAALASLRLPANHSHEDLHNASR